MQQYYEATG